MSTFAGWETIMRKTVKKNFAGIYLFGIMAPCLVAWAQPSLFLTPEPPSITLSPTRLPEKTVQDEVLLLLKAIEGDRYADFTAVITDDFKAALSREAFKAMRSPVAPRLQNGYDLSYLGELNKHEYTTYVWKIVFRDPGDNRNDVMVTFSIKDAHESTPTPQKVAGFSLD